MTVQKWAGDLAGKVDHIDVSPSHALLSCTLHNSPEALTFQCDENAVMPRRIALLCLVCT